MTPVFTKVNTLTAAVAQWLEFTPWAGGHGFDPRPRHTKDVIKMVPDASLLGAQHIRTGLASLSSQTSFKKEMDTIRNERSRVIITSWDNLFRNRPYNKLKFKLTLNCLIISGSIYAIQSKRPIYYGGFSSQLSLYAWRTGVHYTRPNQLTGDAQAQ